ncbi:UNKNOWN [Stylonychia lemnae]|uniref:Thioredoxin-like fold domain-containing protein n=1 Tax=Stylonychia lemnae TaxID=5949 RepID=A0A078APU5_STYLE|nr:UNKNOWN [Stylonychia lemnae]|eukprot:CDW83991.1 UNKNOWN [Stylonychia lemnae]
MQQLLGSTLTKVEQNDAGSPGSIKGPGDYRKVDVDVLELLQKTQIIGLFFAAHWSGPCIGWGSLLQSFKNEMNQETNNFLEIVMVPMSGPTPDMIKYLGESSQEVQDEEKQLLDFLNSCQCLMIPIEEQHNIEQLKEKFFVQELPTFVVLDRFGSEVSKDGIADIKKLSKQQLITKWSENFKKEQLQQL